MPRQAWRSWVTHVHFSPRTTGQLAWRLVASVAPSRVIPKNKSALPWRGFTASPFLAQGDRSADSHVSRCRGEKPRIAGYRMSAPLSGLSPSVAAGKTVSPPSSTSDLYGGAVSQRTRECESRTSSHRYSSTVATRCPPF